MPREARSHNYALCRLPERVFASRTGLLFLAPSQGVKRSAGRAIRDGYGEDRRSVERDGHHVTIWYDNPGGMCGRSCEAMVHWTSLALGWNIDDEGRTHTLSTIGYEVAERSYPPLAAQLIAGPRHPIIEIGKKLWYLARGDGARELFGDDEHLAEGEMTDELRDRVDAARFAGRCECEFCAMLRKKRTSLRKVSAGSAPAAIRAAFAAATSDSEGRAAAAAAATAIRSTTEAGWDQEPLGPAALRAFHALLLSRGAPLSTRDAAGLAVSVAGETGLAKR